MEDGSKFEQSDLRRHIKIKIFVADLQLGFLI